MAIFEAPSNDVDLVRSVRAFVADESRELVSPDLVDDAVLVASELVTNAVLHAGGVASVRVDPVTDGLRVEVRDRTRIPPVMAHSSSEAMTGRGLRLVASLAAQWGVEPTGDGKVVWADLSESGSSTPSVDELLDLWEDAEWAETVTVVERHRVFLGDVPTDLLLAAKSHVDSLVREFTLVARGEASGVTGVVPPHLASLVEAVVTRFAEARQAIKRQALAGANLGLSHVSLALTLPADAADAGEDYLRALDEADSYCRAARLLTLESPPQHRVFRQWYVGEIVAQLRAAARGELPSPPESFEQRLLRELDAVAKAQRASERAARLYEVSAALARAATYEEVAAAVLEQGVTALGASGGGLLLATDAERLSVPGTAGYDEDVVARLRAESINAELPAAVSLRTGEPVWLESWEDRDTRFPELANLERRTISLCAVPLAIGNRRLGALRFSFPEPRLFDEDERRFVLTLATQAAQALDRAQLYDQRLELSRRLQRSLLPGRFSPPAGIEIAAVYRPLGDGMELGGDFYDVWPLGNGGWGLSIADAAGTGPEAAALATMVRFTLRALAVSDGEPSSVLTKLNGALLDAEASGVLGEQFCTALFGVLWPEGTPTVTLANGGHPYPIVRRADGSVEVVAVAGSLLGVLEDAPMGHASVALLPGDTLVLHTDGATEARGGGAMFGDEGLRAAIAAAPPGARAVADAIEAAVLRHVGGAMSDDVAALVVHVTP